MSVTVIGHMAVDPANVQKLWKDRKADFQTVVKSAKAAGALHHRWAFGDGTVVIIDEWPDADSFQKFFESETRIAELMAAGGVQGPPQFEILESRSDAPDEF